MSAAGRARAVEIAKTTEGVHQVIDRLTIGPKLKNQRLGAKADGGTIMEHIGVRTLVNRGILFAAVLAVVIASGGLSRMEAQSSRDWTVDRAQRAVRQHIINREGGRDVFVRFNSDTRTEVKSNSEMRVRGTGIFSRDNDGQSRRFSYEAVVKAPNSDVSDLKYEWQGGWYASRGYQGNTYAANQLTGTYRLDRAHSDNPATVTDRVTRDLPDRDQQRLRNSILRRLEAPDSLAIERRGRTITMASSLAGRITFEADGREQTEHTRYGRSLRTKATLDDERLMVSTEGDRAIDYQVTFEPRDNGRTLRITRRITDEGLRQPVEARSVYQKTSGVAQLGMYPGGREIYPTTGVSGDFLVVPSGTPLTAILNDDLSSDQARTGDRVSLTVRSPAQYEGARIEGRVAEVNRSGRVSGRAGMSFDFDRIRFPDGRTSDFAGYLESVRTTRGETVQVDNEGKAQDDDSQADRTVTRTGIGAGVGAVIGALAGGGRGAAIGAAVGAGAGAGSVFVQGRDDLELMQGTEFRLRAGAPQ